MEVSERNQRWRNRSSFGLFREGEGSNEGSMYTKSKRFQMSFAIVVAALLIVTVVFVVLQVSRSTRETLAEAKKFVRHNNGEEKKPKIDVDMIPESNNHPNHRYDQNRTRDEILERMMKEIYKEWTPEGELKKKNNIRDIIRRIEMREKSKRKEARNSGLGKPILLKGVFRNKEKEEGVEHKHTDLEYFKEINELLQGEKTSTEEKRVAPYRGSPFQLKDQADDITEVNGKSSEETRKKSRKPITVMLEIYPITQSGEEMAEGRQKPFVFGEPNQRGGKRFSYALLPNKNGGLPKNKRMIMKLNLFPKNQPDGRESPNRRTFGWLKKKPEDHICHLVTHDSGWRPITAEWKDEEGNWIKANHLTLKYWDRN